MTTLDLIGILTLMTVPVLNASYSSLLLFLFLRFYF